MLDGQSPKDSTHLSDLAADFDCSRELACHEANTVKWLAACEYYFRRRRDCDLASSPVVALWNAGEKRVP